MPKLTELKAKYKPLGLKSVAIHMPRYEADTDLAGVKAAIEQHASTTSVPSITAKLKDAFLTSSWVPVYYLFDADGKLKSRAAGEFGVSVLSGALEKMFPEQAAAA